MTFLFAWWFFNIGQSTNIYIIFFFKKKLNIAVMETLLQHDLL